MKTFKYIFRVGLVLIAFSFSAQAQIITTIAGDSTAGYNGNGISALTAELNQPIGVAVDGAGNVYIGDRDNNRIRKVNTSGIISTIAGGGTSGLGDNGPATAAELNEPYGVAIDGIGNVYIADAANNRIRKVNTSGVITTIAGTGTQGYNGDNIAATTAELYSPSGVIIDADGNVYITDAYNNRVRKVNTSGIITTIAGTGTMSDTGNNGPATAATVYQPYGITLDASGNIYFTEQYIGHVRKINTSDIISAVAGYGMSGLGDNGPATAAEIKSLGIAIDKAGNIFISDAGYQRIRIINTSGLITTYAGTGVQGFSGDGGPALDADFFDPDGIALDGAGNLYIADFANNRVRRIISTVSVKSVNPITDKLTVYPNPTSGDVMLNLSSALEQQVNVNITNVAGEQVKEFTITTNNPLNIKLDERVGLYFINVITPTSVYNAKLVLN